MKYPIEIINTDTKKKYEFITKTWGIKNTKNTNFSLIIKNHRIELQNNLKNKEKNIWVDFNYKKFQKYKKDKKIKIIQTLGIKKNYIPHVLDSTAGVGKDSFIFFSHGCKVTMVEKNPILSILLYDGLYRGFQNHKIGILMKKNIQLIYNTSNNLKKIKILKPDVIYLDPMFPQKKKKSLPKKNMQTIQKLIGNDTDSHILFQQCKQFAKNRIVVKRKMTSKYISNDLPDFNIKTKKHRFDIYLIKKK
ncbi:class I SAM-dependent methyltransferase [Buchnera aphidicola]|uniref:class I SAM-dependent methyltransferase n=1 Tax=Buchnera aphidicola TaxID=9 RepID=UPI003463EAF4